MRYSWGETKKNQYGVYTLKIKDRIVLGTIAGLAGGIVKTGIDEASLRMGISQRPFREAASGVWVAKKRDAKNSKGQVLGSLFDFGMSALGGIGITYLLSKTGRDHSVAKGTIFGIAMGSGITSALSVLSANRVKPKGASSNLSYMVAHAAYGIAASTIVAKLGDPSLFDVEPINDYLRPTEPTTEELQDKEHGYRY
jgi:hypothetical protein